MKYIEVLWPFLSTPVVRAMLRRRPKKCHPRRGCMRVIPERVGRVLRPIIPGRYTR